MLGLFCLQQLFFHLLIHIFMPSRAYRNRKDLLL